jgi:hypothetical protein
MAAAGVPCAKRAHPHWRLDKKNACRRYGEPPGSPSKPPSQGAWQFHGSIARRTNPWKSLHVLELVALAP